MDTSKVGNVIEHERRQEIKYINIYIYIYTHREFLKKEEKDKLKYQYYLYKEYFVKGIIIFEQI